MSGAFEKSVMHGMAELQPGVRLHYVQAGAGPRTMVLLHGYPQTWWECGMMVAYAFASSFPKSVESLILMEAPLPGTETYDQMVATPKLNHVMHWHFFFHNADNNLAESLTIGRERLYLQSFYQRLAFNQDAIGLEDLNRYAVSFEAAGAMRAGFELYRAFDHDGEDNRATLKKSGRLTLPVLALGGASSFFAPIAKPMLKEVAKEVTATTIPQCGHWVAEENPEAFLREVFEFTRESQ